MNRIFALSLASIALLFACTRENGGGQNNQDDIIVTGEALEVMAFTATFTGYANLPFELGNAEVGIMYDKTNSFEGARKVVATELDGNNKFTVSVTGLSPSTAYYYKSYVQDGMAVKFGAVKSFTTKEPKCPIGAENLGIVMTRKDGTTYNLYWAKSNLSASGLCANPEDYGDYYAWGETEPKSVYSWSTYKFLISGDCYDNLKFSKYNTSISFGTVDNKTVLDPEDDVAHVKLGGKWRMPTSDEWDVIRAQCAWTWITLNGTNGMKVTATNGNSIFLPATGFWATTANPVEMGYQGVYWSSRCRDRLATVILIASGSFDRDSHSRCSGYSVRPVFEE